MSDLQLSSAKFLERKLWSAAAMERGIAATAFMLVVGFACVMNLDVKGDDATVGVPKAQFLMAGISAFAIGVLLGCTLGLTLVLRFFL